MLSLMDKKFPNIPEYDLNDTMANRLVTLVRVEQWMDERTITKELIEDLVKIRDLAQDNNERRIVSMATLIIDHSRKYF